MSAVTARVDAGAPSPRRRGRPRKTEDERDEGNRRRDLVRAAAKLFRRKGFDATTTRDIAAAVGMHAGSPFYHFKSKRALLQAVMEEGLRAASARLVEALGATADDPPGDTRPLMRRLIRAHFDTLLAPGQDFIPVMLYEWRALTPRQRAGVKSFSDAYEDLWRPMLQRLADEGRLRGDLALARLLMFGAMNWSAQWYDHRKRASLDDLADATLALFVHDA